MRNTIPGKLYILRIIPDLTGPVHYTVSFIIITYKQERYLKTLLLINTNVTRSMTRLVNRNWVNLEDCSEYLSMIIECNVYSFGTGSLQIIQRDPV